MRINTECNKCGAIINTKIKTMGHHTVSVRCVFCGNIEEYEVDKENGVEKKLNNYQTIIAKNHKKIENQKNEITRLQNALNMANGTVAGLMDEVSDYQNIVKYKNEKFISEINNIEKRYESQLKVHENELDRRLTIIHYLEDRLFNKGE